MATKKKRKEMVFHKELTNVPTRPTRHPLPPPPFVLLNSVRVGVDDGTDKEEDRMKKSSTGNMAKGSTAAKGIPENLPAKITCQGISVTLDNNVMWNKFFSCKTEMILTQDGSRMFPYCRFRISGLDASKMYSLVVDIQPVDSSQYEWTGQDWQVSGKAACHVKSQPFCHPESPSTGQHWMKQPVSFYKLKLTNTVPGQDKEGNLVLHPLHRYLPLLHVVPFKVAKKELKLNGPRVVSFTFPQTEFYAVTAYQNSMFTQLKVDYNPFAKGLKDEGSSSLALTLKSAASNGKQADHDQKPPVKKSLKSLLVNHKPKSSAAADHKHLEASLIPAASSSTEQCSSKAQPSQKLFSELIREAHVSLRRCNLDKMAASMMSTCEVKENDSGVEPPIVAVCTAVNEKSAMAFCPAPKSQIKPPLALLHCKSKSNPQPEENVRPHKRPALVPLPALARFLSKHQSKHKNMETKQEPQSTPPSEAPPSKVPHPPKAASIVQSLGGSHSGSNCVSPLSTLHHQEPTQEAHVLALQMVVPEVIDSTQVLPSTVWPLSTSEEMHLSTSTHAPGSLPTAIDTFLTDITDSSTTSQCNSTNTPASLRPDSSPISFEPLSPASSPEPMSLGLGSLPSSAVVHTALQWHSLFPQPDPFFSSYTPFHATPQSPTQHPPAQLCPQAPSVTSDNLLDEEEYQSLSFTGELSPLGLHLSLSPTFSSLDGGALSPTPSLSDLLSFISTDNNNLLLEAESEKTEHTSVPCPPVTLTVPAKGLDSFPQVQSEPEPTTKSVKVKKCRKGQSKAATINCNAVYTKMQPSLEEVEEQLFVSFTSKEALKLHLHDPPESPGAQPLESSNPPPTTPPPPEEALPQPNTPPPDTGGMVANATGNHLSPGEGPDGHKETVAAFQEVLLRDLKLMKNRQVIHPVLQEVGLKMQLLDPSLGIDMQYLGVRLPIPPHHFSLEAQASSPKAPTPLPPQSGCLDFVSRTGKTSDITQIKGWREKFSPSESSTSSSFSRPEAAASSEPPSKNLSAFCSDMLDEYLENEGKLLDQQGSSFSQARPEPMAYELPTQGSSYIWTPNNVLKKQPLSTPTSTLISSFVPPSKRPRPIPPTTKKFKPDRKQKIVSSKLKSKPASLNDDMAPTSISSAAGPEQHLGRPLTLTTSPAQAVMPSIHPSLTSQTLYVSDADPPRTETIPIPTPNNKALKKSKKLKSFETLVSKDLVAGCQDMAPLESDSELGPAGDEATSQSPKPKALVSVTLLRQKDLEDGVVWEGRPRTCITEERATVALASLFTTAGFVREDPTAPIELVKRWAPPCRNDFCRLGCVCSSLAKARRITHCGKVECMLGCSCLRQKVVLLKNLDGLDSGPSDLEPSKRKRKKRMKMAYVLKETDCVAQPALPVRTLWKGGDVDPEPVYTPEFVPLPRNQGRRMAVNKGMTCARVRGYPRRKMRNHIEESEERISEGLQGAEKPTNGISSKGTKPTNHVVNKSTKQTNPVKRTKQTSNKTASTTETVQELSKHLVIMADCQWPSSEVQTHVLMAVCQAMVQEKLHTPFWFNKYYIKLLSFAIKDGFIQYKVHISENHMRLDLRPGPDQTAPGQSGPGLTGPGQTAPTSTGGKEEWVEELQKKVEAGESVDEWQKKVEAGEAVEEWQKEVEEEDLVKNNKDLGEECEKEIKMGLPFLSGLSQTGFLSAQRKQSVGSNLLVQVNGKAYPMAKVQLGRMGALHPANRLAAYLTGRVRAPLPPRPPTSETTALTSSPVPPTADQKSPELGSPGKLELLRNASGQLFQRKEGKLVRLIPLSQVKSLKVNPGGPWTHYNPRYSQTVLDKALGPPSGVKAHSVVPHSIKPATSLQLQLVSANHISSKSLVITNPKLCPLPPAAPSGLDQNITPAAPSGLDQNITPAAPRRLDQNITPAASSGLDQNITPAASSGLDQNITPAASSGLDQNITPAASSGLDQNITPAASSGLDQNITPAACSGLDQNITPAASSGLDQNITPAASSGPDLNIIYVDNECNILTNEEYVGGARSSKEKPSLVGVQKAEPDAGLLLSSDSSDSSSDSVQPQHIDRNSLHNLLEKKRRHILAKSMSRLQREMGLQEKTPKIMVLKKALKEVEELRSRESSLEQLKSSLVRRRAKLKRQREERSRTNRTGRTEDAISRNLPQLYNQHTEQTGSELPLAAEAVALLNETDEKTENSSDEENLPSGTDHITIPSDDDDGINIETSEDKCPPSEDKRCLGTAFRSLRSTLDSEARTRLQLLNEASNEICNLKKDQWYLGRGKKALKRQHNALLKHVSTISGKILDELQRTTAKQSQLEKMESKPPLDLTSNPPHDLTSKPPLDLTSNPPLDLTSNPPLDLTSNPPLDLTSKPPLDLTYEPPLDLTSKPPLYLALTSKPRLYLSAKPPLYLTAKPPLASKPPLYLTTKPPLALTSKPPLDLTSKPPPQASQEAQLRVGPRTIPNILVRRKTLPSQEDEAAPTAHTTLMPAELLSLVCTLPGQVLTLSGPDGLPKPGCPFPTLLYLVPQPTLQEQGSQNQTLAAGSLPLQQTFQAGSLPLNQTLPAGSLPFQQTLPAGSLPFQQTLPAGSLPFQQTIPAGSLPFQQTIPAGFLPLQQTLLLSGVPGRGHGATPREQSPSPPPTESLPQTQPEEQQQVEEVEGEGLSHLLNELSFLNQNHGPLLSLAPGAPLCSLGVGAWGGGHGPSLLTEDLMEAMQMNVLTQGADGAEPNGYGELQDPQCSSKGDKLTPPPLKKVGGANVSMSTKVRPDGTWKPMPRLAAMGLKGGPPPLTSELASNLAQENPAVRPLPASRSLHG